MAFLNLFVFFGFMYLVWFFVKEYNPMEKDMDWYSYLFAKTAKWYLPSPYPYNTTFALSVMRKVYDISLIYPTQDLVRRSPDLQKIETSTIDVKIPVEFNGLITARIYNGHQPKTPTAGEELKPVLVWYHGGGMIIGSMEGAHGNCLKIANHTGFVVVNVDYRLAPEFIFPTPLNDAYTAFLWVEENIAKYGGDPKRLTIGGDSAGGYLATTISARYLDAHISNEKAKLKCNGEVCPDIEQLPAVNLIGILDVYPGLNVTTDSEEAKLYDKTSGILPIAEADWMRSLYQGSKVPDFEKRRHYWFSPFNTPDEILRFFPPTIFVFAKYDILTPEGLLFREKLQKLKVPTETLFYPSTIHAFYGSDLIPVGNVAVAESSQLLLRLVRTKE